MSKLAHSSDCMDNLPKPPDDHGGPVETPVERAAYLMQRAAREYRDTAALVTDPTKAAPFVSFAVKLESAAADIVRLVDASPSETTGGEVRAYRVTAESVHDVLSKVYEDGRYDLPTLDFISIAADDALAARSAPPAGDGVPRVTADEHGVPTMDVEGWTTHDSKVRLFYHGKTLDMLEVVLPESTYRKPKGGPERRATVRLDDLRNALEALALSYCATRQGGK